MAELAVASENCDNPMQPGTDYKLPRMPAVPQARRALERRSSVLLSDCVGHRRIRSLRHAGDRSGRSRRSLAAGRFIPKRSWQPGRQRWRLDGHQRVGRVGYSTRTERTSHVIPRVAEPQVARESMTAWVPIGLDPDKTGFPIRLDPDKTGSRFSSGRRLYGLRSQPEPSFSSGRRLYGCTRSPSRRFHRDDVFISPPAASSRHPGAGRGRSLAFNAPRLPEISRPGSC